MKTLRFSPVCFHNPAVADTWLYPLADLRRVKAGKSLSLFATDFSDCIREQPGRPTDMEALANVSAKFCPQASGVAAAKATTTPSYDRVSTPL